MGEWLPGKGYKNLWKQKLIKFQLLILLKDVVLVHLEIKEQEQIILKLKPRLYNRSNKEKEREWG